MASNQQAGSSGLEFSNLKTLEQLPPTLPVYDQNIVDRFLRIELEKKYHRVVIDWGGKWALTSHKIHVSEGVLYIIVGLLGFRKYYRLTKD